MGGWTSLADATWQQFESIFDLRLRTPPCRRIPPQTPNAPRKAITQTRRVGLKPRKLIYDLENYAGRLEVKPKNNKTQAWEDSGVAVWTSSSSTLRMEDSDKENRPESEDVISNSQDTKITPGSLRDRLNRQLARRTTLILSQLEGL